MAWREKPYYITQKSFKKLKKKNLNYHFMYYICRNVTKAIVNHYKIQKKIDKLLTLTETIVCYSVKP